MQKHEAGVSEDNEMEYRDLSKLIDVLPLLAYQDFVSNMKNNFLLFEKKLFS